MDIAELSQIQPQKQSRSDACCDRNMHRHVVHLQIITLAWMLVECAAALFSAWKAHSPVLLAFGSDSFVELLSATVVILQFALSFTLSTARATRVAGILLFVLAAVVAFTSLAALVGGAEPETGMGKLQTGLCRWTGNRTFAR